MLVQYSQVLLAIAGLAAASPAPHGSIVGRDVQPRQQTMYNLNRRGWTAIADTESVVTNPQFRAHMVLDGDRHTFWHSDYVHPSVLPHWIMIDQGFNYRSHCFEGLKYTPRPDDYIISKNGNIGEFTVDASNDTINWTTLSDGQTWADRDDQSEKTVLFGEVVARYVRLTAKTEAGGRGPWTAISELNLVSSKRQF